MGWASRRDCESDKSIETIQWELEKNQAKLQKYAEAKGRLEKSMEKHIREVQSLDKNIQQVEIQIERLVQEAVAEEVRDRSRRELALIKEEDEGLMMGWGSQNNSKRMKTIQLGLEKAQAKLQIYVDAKNLLKKSMEKHIRKAQCLDKNIAQAEIQIERLLQEAVAEELRGRFRREALIKEESNFQVRFA